MERINSAGGSRFNKSIIGKKKNERKKKVSGSLFSNLLSSEKGGEVSGISFSESDDDQSIEEMLDGIFEIGERLKEKPTFLLVKEYKQAVSGFLKHVVSSSFLVEEEISGFNILKRKRFLLVRVIDEKLERLASSILRDQAEQLELLKRVEEINGLLVDLFR